MSTLLKDTELRVKAVDALQTRNIMDIETLSKIPDTQLAQIPGIGKRDVRDIYTVLNGAGFNREVDPSLVPKSAGTLKAEATDQVGGTCHLPGCEGATLPGRKYCKSFHRALHLRQITPTTDKAKKFTDEELFNATYDVNTGTLNGVEAFATAHGVSRSRAYQRIHRALKERGVTLNS